jgi:hypothetical protein
MNEQSSLPYRLTMYVSCVAGLLLGLYGNWGPSALLLLIAMIMQWRRRLPPGFEMSRWTGVIAAALLIALDLYGIFVPETPSFLGQ